MTSKASLMSVTFFKWLDMLKKGIEKVTINNTQAVNLPLQGYKKFRQQYNLFG